MSHDVQNSLMKEWIRQEVNDLTIILEIVIPVNFLRQRKIFAHQNVQLHRE